MCDFRVNWVSLDCLAILEDKDPRSEKHTDKKLTFQVTLVTEQHWSKSDDLSSRVLWDSRDSLVPTARRELG